MALAEGCSNHSAAALVVRPLGKLARTTERAAIALALLESGPLYASLARTAAPRHFRIKASDNTDTIVHFQKVARDSDKSWLLEKFRFRFYASFGLRCTRR